MSNLGPRPRSLPLAPEARPATRKLHVFNESRPQDRHWRPVYAVWEITLQCDLACRHCGSRAGRARPDELDTAQALDLISQMASLGVKEVTIIGGEAYLRSDWLEIIRALRSHNIQCSMTTGGRGLSRERLREGQQAGLQGISVSVDGSEATHDALRGVKGSYAAALDAITFAQELGLQVSSNTQINRASLREIPDTFERLVQHGIRAWQVQLTVAMGRAVDEPDMLLQPYQMIEVLPMLARLQPLALANGVLLWPGNNIGYFGPYETVLRGKHARGHMSSCGAGRIALGIEANGDIKGCPSLPTSDYVGGNIRDHSLLDIWERSEPLRFTRDRTVDDLWGYCRECYYNDTCRAGCSWTAHVLFGRPGNNPYCHHRALELLQQGKRERIRRTQPAPGEPFDQGRFETIVEPWPEHTIERARELARTGEGWLIEEPA